MAKTEQAVENGTSSSLIENLGKAILELEARKADSEEKLQWKEIEEHFHTLETILKKKFEELEDREKEYEMKESETLELLAEREAAVAAKEQDLLDRVQELKDVAVAAIEEAQANYQPMSLEPLDGGNSKVSCSFGDTDSPEDLSHKTSDNAEGVATDVKPRPELAQFCELMDAKGLLNFIMENHKNLNAIRLEVSVALENVADPARLVLESLEGFYPSDESTLPVDTKDATLQGKRSRVIIMEAMATFMARIEPGVDHHLTPEVKQQAKATADDWRSKLFSAGIEVSNRNSLEVEAFLQLLSTFRIASEFDQEELCKLALVVAQRRQAPELCRSLGLAPKIPGLVESLVDSGKQIDAVHFIHAFQLVETFPPVPLLKTYLKEIRRKSQGKGAKSGDGASSLQIDVNAQELAALKAVIRCVEQYKLEADYPLDPLHVRKNQLEKSKFDKKRNIVDSDKHPHSKRSRGNGVSRGFRAPGSSGSTSIGRHGPSVYSQRAQYVGMPETYAAAPNPYGYQVSVQTQYAQQANDQAAAAAAALQQYYTQDDRIPSSSSNYGTYMVGNGLQPTHQPYM